MQYFSTRGRDGPLGYEEALLSGLARDGGLYLPEAWPKFSYEDIAAMQGLSYAELAGRIMAPFCVGDIDEAELTTIARDAYADFDHPDIAPLKPLQENLYILELFHGPTIAFKDYAMQILARAFDRALKKKQQHAVIVGATSGDTGSAALEAFKGLDAVDAFILFPEGRVSPVQQRQMTSVISDGSHAVSVAGDFDDCQAIVKALFNDLEFRDKVNLSAINSINWARLMPQIVYYFAAALRLGAPDKRVAFSVPTGNFGNVFAGYIAAQMGLPVSRLIIASNQNDILPRFFANGVMARESVVPSLSPSMDIQVSSNFERLLFELLDRDGQATDNVMRQFGETGKFYLNDAVLARARQLFSAYSLNDEGTIDEIAATAKNNHMVIDPHSAIGLYAARQAHADGTVADDVPIVSLACAHPAKFDAAVTKATGVAPGLPAHLADLMYRPERKRHVAATANAVKSLVLEMKRNT